MFTKRAKRIWDIKREISRESIISAVGDLKKTTVLISELVKVVAINKRRIIFNSCKVSFSDVPIIIGKASKGSLIRRS